MANPLAPERFKVIGVMLGDSHRCGPELVKLIVDAARNDREIRHESVQALAEIAAGEHESSEIRDAAKAAIDEILHSPKNQL